MGSIALCKSDFGYVMGAYWEEGCLVFVERSVVWRPVTALVIEFTSLLPFEAELCNTLGISKEEYFEYLRLAELAPVRGKEYEIVPDVENGVTAIIAVVVKWWPLRRAS